MGHITSFLWSHGSQNPGTLSTVIAGMMLDVYSPVIWRFPKFQIGIFHENQPGKRLGYPHGLKPQSYGITQGGAPQNVMFIGL